MNNKSKYICIIFLSLITNSISPAAQIINSSDLDERLVTAVYNNDYNTVEKLLGQGANVNAPNNMGETMRYDANFLKRLVSKSGGNIIHVAIELAHTEIVQLLINYGADLEAKDASQQTPLMIASSSDDSKIVDIIVKSIEKKSNIRKRKLLNDTDMAQDAPIYRALKQHRTNIIQTLLNAGSEITKENFKEESPYELIVGKTFIKTDNFFTVTITEKEINSALTLLHKGIDPNDWENFPEFLFQNFHKNFQWIHLFLEYGLKIDSIKHKPGVRDNLAKYFFIHDSSDVTLAAILDESFEDTLTVYAIGFKSKGKMTAMHWAAARGNSYLFEKICNFIKLNHGNDVIKYLLNEKNSAGKTPLDLAIRNRDIFKLRPMNFLNFMSIPKFETLIGIGNIIESYLSGDHQSIINLIKEIQNS